ncbi:MAG: glycosyltransferase [Balneolales bacterium]
MITFSIIIPIYNRSEDLDVLLESLMKQTFPPESYELIIVDDGSTENIKGVVDKFLSKAKFGIRYFRQENQGPGKARNTGMDLAENDVIVFIDSDCIIPAHYLSEVADAFSEMQMDAYGGPDTALETFSAWDKAVNYVMTSFFTTGGLRGADGRTLARFYPRSFNMGFKKEIYKKIGGFGSIFQYGEDIEFSHRILKATSRVAFLPDAFVFHKRRSGINAFAKQIYKMGKARVQLSRIDRKLLEPLYLLPAVGILLLASMIMGSIYFEPIRVLLIFSVIAGLLWLIFLTIHGLKKMHNTLAAALVPLAFSIQMFTYGGGMISEWAKSLFNNRP